MGMRNLLAVVVLGLAASGLATSARATDIEPPAGAWAPGDIPSSGPGGSEFIGISGVKGQDGLIREYKVHIPQGYNKRHPIPVVFCLPGLGETVVMLCVRGSNTTPFSGNGTSGGLIDKSEENNFVLVMAEGYDHSWNGGNCCATAAIKQLDDVALIRAILTEVSKHVNVDAKRVYAVGFSNGAFMADRLACEASDIFAAVFGASGGIRTIPMSGCKPAKTVAVLGTHGQGGKDYWVPYEGDAKSMAQFASANGCSANTVQAGFPASVGDGTQPGDVSCVTYTGCPSSTEVTFCSVQDGGHCWYGSPSCGTGFGNFAAQISLGQGVNTQNIINTDIVWPFLSKYHR